MRHLTTIIGFLVVACIFFVPTSTLVAQITGRDIVYLKNGSIVKGIIVEQVPNKSLKIQTADGSLFVYEFIDIERIEKEGTVTPTQPPQVQQTTGSFLSKTLFTLQGGVAIPLGEFASTTGNAGGAASTGFSFGGELKVPIGRSAFWLLSGTFSFNSMDESAIRSSLGLPSSVSVDAGNWISITPLTGVGVIIPVSETLGLQLSGRLGLLIGTSPELNLSDGSTSISQSSASATAFAYGFAAGILTASNFSIVAQFQSGKPKYTATASGGGSSSSGDFEQSMSLVQVAVGIGL